ncbi:hypothetical protein [Mucilaginibacter lacusdianchii]|uniref:hypothetical protein n=1 Tax=Mucilaginibacter lacusdianchii TaxID=2684211 RepID=UPI00131BEBF9|nr:hypothetical protein [Mucilaginibacter sp. JXJ CY 39]
MMIANNPDIFKFIKSFLVILLAILLCDWLLGNALGYLYSKQQSGVLYRTSYAIDSTKADYLVVGASRANHHYDPRVFESSIHSSFYNCGRDKQSIFYSCAVISSILNRYTPKYVIIEIKPDEFSQFEEGELATLLPYYNNNAVKPYLKYNGKFQQVKMLSHIYPYNSLITNLLVGLDRNWIEDYKGYVPKTSVISNTKLEPLKEKGATDSLKVKELYNLLGRLNNKNIPTLLVISPMHYKYVNSVTTSICQQADEKFSNTAFLNFANNKSWIDNKLYSDDYHLNVNGARLFSKQIAEYINQQNKHFEIANQTTSSPPLR